MSTKEQSVTLLRKNKEAQVAAFQSVGMSGVTVASRASEFGKYIQWAGGLLDLCVACQRLSDGSKWYFIQNLSGKDWMPAGNFPDGMQVLYDPIRERIVFRGERFPENFRLGHGGCLLLLPDEKGAEIDFELSEFCKPTETLCIEAPGIRQGECGVYTYDFEFSGKWNCLEIASQIGVMEVSVNGCAPQVLWGSGRLSIAEWCNDGCNKLQIRFANSAGLIYGDPNQSFGISSIYLTK